MTVVDRVGQIQVRTLLGLENADLVRYSSPLRGEIPRATVRFSDGVRISAYYDLDAQEWVAVGVPRRSAS